MVIDRIAERDGVLRTGHTDVCRGQSDARSEPQCRHCVRWSRIFDASMPKIPHPLHQRGAGDAFDWPFGRRIDVQDIYDVGLVKTLREFVYQMLRARVAMRLKYRVNALEIAQARGREHFHVGLFRLSPPKSLASQWDSLLTCTPIGISAPIAQPQARHASTISAVCRAASG